MHKDLETCWCWSVYGFAKPRCCRYILVNVRFETDTTYAEWAASATFEDNVHAAGRANNTTPFGDFHYSAEGSVLRKLITTVPEIGAAKISMVCEIQLHLDKYITARKRTHLYFKVERADNIYALKRDCRVHFGI